MSEITCHCMYVNKLVGCKQTGNSRHPCSISSHSDRRVFVCNWKSSPWTQCSGLPNLQRPAPRDVPELKQKLCLPNLQRPAVRDVPEPKQELCVSCINLEKVLNFPETGLLQNKKTYGILLPDFWGSEVFSNKSEQLRGPMCWM